MKHKILLWLMLFFFPLALGTSCNTEVNLENIEYEGKILSLIKNNNNELYNIILISPPLKTIFQHKACINKLYADSFYKVQKSSHSSFEVICCGS